MRSKFPGYFKPAKGDIKALWDNAIFTFDTNILLNLYRYSDETREEFYKILEKLKDKIWLSNQSAFEFFENRLNVISQQEKAYEDMIGKLAAIEEDFKNTRQHPFVSDSSLQKFSKLAKEICSELEKSKEVHNNRIVDDEVLMRIEELFADRVGGEYKLEEFNKLIKEGEERFKLKVPPGYKDSSKKDASDLGARQYGDLIVWKQIIDKAKESQKGIILVTDDRKEDWWMRFKGKTIQPRPELIKEFKNEVNQEFHMYQSDRFLEFSREQLSLKVNQNAINEIRELREMDYEERKIKKDILRKERMVLIRALDNKSKELFVLDEKFEHIVNKSGQLKQSLEEQKKMINANNVTEKESQMLDFIKTSIEFLNVEELNIKKNKDRVMHESLILKRRLQTVHDAIAKDIH